MGGGLMQLVAYGALNKSWVPRVSYLGSSVFTS